MQKTTGCTIRGLSCLLQLRPPPEGQLLTHNKNRELSSPKRCTEAMLQIVGMTFIGTNSDMLAFSILQLYSLLVITNPDSPRTNDQRPHDVCGCCGLTRLDQMTLQLSVTPWYPSRYLCAQRGGTRTSEPAKA